MRPRGRRGVPPTSTSLFARRFGLSVYGWHLPRTYHPPRPAGFHRWVTIQWAAGCGAFRTSLGVIHESCRRPRHHAVACAVDCDAGAGCHDRPGRLRRRQQWRWRAGPTGPRAASAPRARRVDGSPGSRHHAGRPGHNRQRLHVDGIADRAIETLVVDPFSASIAGNRAVIQFTVKTAHGGPVLGLAPTTLRLGSPSWCGGEQRAVRWQSYINRTSRPATPRRGRAGAGERDPGEHGVGRFRQLLAARGRLLGGTRRRRLPVPVAVDLTTVTAPMRRLRADADASRQHCHRPVEPVAPTRARQPVRGLRAGGRRRHDRQVDRRHRELRGLPRALRRARRPAPHGLSTA